MKSNLPVTQRDIDYPESKVFVTKTDTKGIITYANDSFVEVSGFSREELIGVNHNLVRHPDMPEEQLQDEVQRNAITTKKPYYAIEDQNGKPVFRAVTPYLVSHNFHGTDCLTCHQVDDGSVNGVSDIKIDLSADYDKLHRTIIEQVGIQIAFQVTLFFFIRLVVQRFVVRPVDEIKAHLSEVINGHMTRHVDISGRDEMGEVLCSVQSTKVLLGSIIDQIMSVSAHIDDRAKHLSEAMTMVSEGSQSQSDAASSMASAVEEMTVSIDHIAENTGEVRRISDNSSTLASEGGKIVQQVVADMNITNQAVMKTAGTMQDLGAQSDRIQEVVKVIKEIADQTNLLALNAAIEAARAGEQGRGFAVVADEVRKLAEKTGRSTQEIAQMVAGIRNSTGQAITEMGTTVEMVRAGSAMAEKAGCSIVQINEGVARALSGVEDISSSINQQSAASREIAVNVEKVAHMSDQNTNAVREVFGTVDNLKTLSSALAQSIRHFRV